MAQHIETDINIGLTVRNKMREYGTSIAWLAQQTDCDRSNLGKQLHKTHIYPELLLKISIAENRLFCLLFRQNPLNT
ncbi:hypothetical protein FACS189434_01850 [Bacteroidia bacterium]|nr:hypothetical protein FACS189434_01850 [Bacteroidia bacterium]